MNFYQLSGTREEGAYARETNDDDMSNSRRGGGGGGDDDHDDLQSAIDDIYIDVSPHSSSRSDADNGMDTSGNPSVNETDMSSLSPNEENHITALTRNDETDEAEDTQNATPSAPAELNPSQTTFEGVLVEDPDSMLQNAVEANDVRAFDETGGKWKRWMPFAIGGLVLLVLVAVGVSLGVVIPRQQNVILGTTKSPSAAPSQAPSQAPTSASFSAIAQAIESTFGTTLDDTTSPQYRAAQWMAEEDQLIINPSDDLSQFAQRYAMVVFYYATGGDTSWTRKANFLSPTLDTCSWQEDNPSSISTLGIYGVQCTTIGEGEVFAIEFSQNNLTGTLPDELEACSSLAALFLPSNSLVGPLPSTIFHDNFQFLHLHFNNISGTIPTEIGSGAMLQISFLESSLSGTIPSEIAKNTRLLELTLSYSKLTGTIPDTLLNLSDMLRLDITFNDLSGLLPPTFPTRWPKMEQFSFGSNRLSGTLPDTIGTLPLQSLGAENNSLTGTIPDSLLTASNLSSLTLSFNQLTGSLPFDWSRLSLLEFLTLASNKLNGPLPLSMANLTSLKIANFANNSFSSTIPPDFGALTNIQQITFQENSFTGTVPITIQRWTSLSALALSRNDITGDISFMCNPIDTTLTWIPSIDLYADCFGEVICPCCLSCCDKDDNCESQ